MRKKTTFYQTVMQLPIIWELTQTFPLNNNDPYAEFVGDRKTASNTFNIKALYKTEFAEWERTKYGMHKDVSGALYIPPQVLEQVFGTFRLTWEHIKFRQQGQYENKVPMVVEKVSYQEPLYNTCISVVIHLRDDTYA